MFESSVIPLTNIVPPHPLGKVTLSICRQAPPTPDKHPLSLVQMPLALIELPPQCPDVAADNQRMAQRPANLDSLSSPTPRTNSKIPQTPSPSLRYAPT